ncbi:hypothetical protein EAF04_010295 [Stromatinia cepivora]|nr:hypothetical protein EAF04_010295 [Stromatinia cepivora]
MGVGSSKGEEPALVYLGDFPMAPSRMIVRFKCASWRHFSLAEDPLEGRGMTRTLFPAREFCHKVPLRNMKLKKKGLYSCHYGRYSPFKKRNTRRRNRRGNGSRDVAIRMKELEAWRFKFREENENKRVDRTRSVSPFGQEPGNSRSVTVVDQSQSDSTEKKSPRQSRDTLLSSDCLRRFPNGLVHHKDITIITNATKRQMEHNQTPDVLCIIKFHTQDFCLEEEAVLDMIVHSPTGHKVVGLLSPYPQRYSNVCYFHWEDEAAVDRCIENYHGIFTCRIHLCFLILSRALDNRQVWEVKK